MLAIGGIDPTLNVSMGWDALGVFVSPLAHEGQHLASGPTVLVVKPMSLVHNGSPDAYWQYGIDRLFVRSFDCVTLLDV